jgi:hypothetical protein
MIANGASVFVSFLVAISTTAKPNAAASASSAPGCTVARPGRRITTTPSRPSTTAPIRLAVRRSPSTGSASSSVHAGVVNSSAKVIAMGISSSDVAHR